jgi:hypothetical protein
MTWWTWVGVVLFALCVLEQFAALRVMGLSRKALQAARALRHETAWAMADNARLRVLLQLHQIDPGPADIYSRAALTELAAEKKAAGELDS